MPRQYHPLFLDLRDRKVIVVGNGEEAARRIGELDRAEARIHVFADAPRTEVRAALGASNGTWHRRAPARRDVESAWLVVAERRGDDEDRWLAQACARERVFLHLIDRPQLATAIAPAVVRRGQLAVAVSTGGAAPTLAVRVCQRLDAELPAELAAFVDLMGSLRDEVASRHPSFDVRRRLWYRLVDSDVVQTLREDPAAAMTRGRQILELDALPAVTAGGRR